MTLDGQLEEVLANHDFDPVSLQDDLLKAGIRRLTLSCSATPVLCGSSLKNVAVQPLMEAIVDYLPAPQERTLVNVWATWWHLAAIAQCTKITHTYLPGSRITDKIMQ